MDKIPTNKKEVAKLIFKTAKEAFRRGYRAYKKSKRTHEAYKGKQRQRGDASEGVIPYSKEAIKKAIRSVKFQGRAAKLAKKQKKPPGSRARGISFVGRGYQGDKTKSMQVPMASKVQMRKIRKEISESVKKYMKEKIGRKKEGGEIKEPPKLESWKKGSVTLTPTLKHTWNKGPGKSHRHSTYGGKVKFKKGKFSVEGTWEKDKGKFNEFSYKSKPSKSIILKMAFAKGGLMRTPKLAKRGF